ncbi:hypothetical protein GQ44DRAFT_604639 [Phaeosphaeriaceae sp. PMI808]|nr:hypothetical protein GQ44DRAFT_604639 [Phaeosphaeriaceae sp. PMI808]
MKTATMVGCTLANEALRRRDQPGSDSTLRPRPQLQRHADHLQVSFQDSSASLIGAQRPRRRACTGLSPSTRISIKHRNGGEPADIIGTGPLHYPDTSPGAKSKSASAAQHDSASASAKLLLPSSPPPSEADCDGTGLPRGRISHQRRPSIAGAHDNTRQPPGSPQSFSPSSESDQALCGSRVRHRSMSQSSVQWVPPTENAIKFAHPRPRPEGDAFSPTSDTTLFEEPEALSLDRSRALSALEGSPDYFNFDNDDRSSRTDATPVPTHRRARHSRAPSTEPNFRSAKRASLPLRARTKTNEGLLQLQANPTKPERPTTAQERRISLGIPIKGAIAQAEGLQRSKFGTLLDTPPQTPKTPRTPRTRAPEKSGPAATLRQKERDLEYKHRHTFIGTASLDDFLEVLEVSQDHTTTKAAVGKAFLVLASSERLLARQASSTAVGWDLVSRTIPDVVNTDYVVQAHVKLGSITLWQFLDLIPFDDQEETGAMNVVEAYSAASHMDSKAGVGATSKAKAFRSWMVHQE